MALSHKSNINIQDLEQLREAKTPESKVIEYKLSEPEKDKFLASICSFANCMGGDLLLGVQEEAGVPFDFPGILIPDLDAAIGRFDNIFRDGIEPRISNIRFEHVPIGESKYVLIIRIPRSWALPHRVKATRRFFSRHSTGKYELDIPEVRNAFGLSSTIVDKIRELRTTQIGRIIEGQTPVPMKQGPKLVFHIVPFTAFDPSVRLDAASLAKHCPPDVGWRRRPNFDGFLIAEHEEPIALKYLQVFRNGAMELVDSTGFFDERDQHFLSHHYETMLLEKLPIYLTSLKDLGISPPFSLMLTLIGVSGYTMYVPPFYRNMDLIRKRIEKENLLVPDILLETYEADFTALLKPAFDSIWNAAGLPHSVNYDEGGNWKPR